ncbi:VanZ family protein [Romboutsia ilealis]|uniref:VanZ family protein n=1 Tax=Romboutsia faecis TaxID=2764597 RepID=A0ABR7JRZ8_9FIRM|nr:VanZ family protein [Romboutsia faecis]MBC5997692.1 VanZ family protein [Romboutsia faecis]MRN25360.1 VanZ family protein [Romboutsia ilealis]
MSEVKFTNKSNIRNKINIVKCIGNLIFLVYIVVVLSITHVLYIKPSDFTDMHMAPNLVPLVNTISDFMVSPQSVLRQVVLNIIFFMPFGFLFTMLYLKKNKKLLKVLIISLVFSTCIETLQFFVGRFMDIDDIIWNTSGAVIGSIIYFLINNLRCMKKLNM